MWLLDQWAERHIIEAQRKGEFDNLPGRGEPLILDDDSHVPAELRAGYRLLKNAGCLPPLNWSSAETLFSYLISSTVSGKMTLDTIRLVASSRCLN